MVLLKSHQLWKARYKKTFNTEKNITIQTFQQQYEVQFPPIICAALKNTKQHKEQLTFKTCSQFK